MSRRDRIENKKVTRVPEKRNVTTNNQLNFKITDIERDQLDLLLDKLQNIMPAKKVTKSKVLRAVGYLNSDSKAVFKLAKAIQEYI